MNLTSTGLKHFPLAAVSDYLQKMQDKCFFGTIRIDMQNGKVTLLQPQTTLRPGDPLE